MGSLNKVLLIGNLGKDPELRYTPDGLAILRFSIATSEYFNDKSGNKSERTTWHNIVVFGKMGQNIANYLSKGKQVFVEGRINNRSYDDKEGNKKYITEIVATNIVLLGAKGGGGGGAEIMENENRNDGNNYAAQGGSMDSGYGSAGQQEDDDIPF
ncbi:MAG: single-stranded DNA-binding protein [bacterium]